MNFSQTNLLTFLWHQIKLQEWVGIRKWKLVYRATRDGFATSDFHRQCDGKGENLGVIRSQAGSYLFGWWTPLSWNSQGRYVADASARTFIWTLTNPAGLPAKYNIKPSLTQNAIFGNPSYGPILGYGHDIVVYDKSNTNDDSHTNFPHTFEDTTGRGSNTFTGSK